MDPWLSDTNVLLRSLQPHHPHFREAVGAMQALLRRGERVCVTPQVIREFWNVCTRPTENNGLGMTPVQAENEVSTIEKMLTVLPDVPAVYEEWRQLVVVHSVSGVQVHDVNLVASMLTHGIPRLLTFNANHFRRYLMIQVFTPQEALDL